MTANFETLDQETLSSAIDGIGYGPKTRVLARAGRKLLLWVPGHSGWNGTGQPWRYVSSSLIVHLGDARRGGDYRRLATGGRLKSRIAEQAASIDFHFGEGFHKLLDPSRTVVVGEGG
jgi:hypothetical protein